MTVDKLRKSLKELKPSHDDPVEVFVDGITYEIVTVIRDATSKPATIRLWCRRVA
jgi:hypothetical protein